MKMPQQDYGYPPQPSYGYAPQARNVGYDDFGDWFDLAFNYIFF